MGNTKNCNTCGRVFPLDGFHRKKENRDGHHNHCKECANARTARWAEENPDRQRERVRQWRRSPGGLAYSELQRAKKRRGPYELVCVICDEVYLGRVRHQKTCGRECRGRLEQLRDYGLPPEVWKDWVAAGVCMACGGEASGRMSIDHCHETGLPRGWVHQRCNVEISAIECGRIAKIQEFLDEAKRNPDPRLLGGAREVEGGGGLRDVLGLGEEGVERGR